MKEEAIFMLRVVDLQKFFEKAALGEKKLNGKVV